MIPRCYEGRRIDFTTVLSDELVLYVFAYLSHQDLARTTQASKNWKRLATDQYVCLRISLVCANKRLMLL